MHVYNDIYIYPNDTKYYLDLLLGNYIYIYIYIGWLDKLRVRYVLYVIYIFSSFNFKFCYQ